MLRREQRVGSPSARDVGKLAVKGQRVPSGASAFSRFGEVSLVSTRRSLLLVATIFVVLFVPGLLIVRSWQRVPVTERCTAAFEQLAGERDMNVRSAALIDTVRNCSAAEWTKAARQTLGVKGADAEVLYRSACDTATAKGYSTTACAFRV